jgi:hypothetical protein
LDQAEFEFGVKRQEWNMRTSQVAEFPPVSHKR